MVATLSGTPASIGCARGVAYVEGAPHDRALGLGDIFVCHALDDRAGPIAEAAAGVVTDVGGPLSHGATRMRELHHPTVVAVHEATSHIVDGELIEVDADRGLVRPVG